MTILSPQQTAFFAEELNRSSALKEIGTKVPVSETGLLTPVIEGEIKAAKQTTVDGKKTVSTITVSSESYVPDPFYTLVEIPKRKYDGGGEELFQWIVEKSAEQIAAELDKAAYGLLEGATETVDYEPSNFAASIRAAMKKVTTDGFLFDSTVEPDALGAVTGEVDIEGKAGVARLYGRKTVFTPDLAEDDASGTSVGYAGGFKNNLIWGIVDDHLDVTVSLDGTAGDRSALERNLVFVRVEVLAFVALVNAGKIVKIVTL